MEEDEGGVALCLEGEDENRELLFLEDKKERL